MRHLCETSLLLIDTRNRERKMTTIIYDNCICKYNQKVYWHRHFANNFDEIFALVELCVRYPKPTVAPTAIIYWYKIVITMHFNIV